MCCFNVQKFINLKNYNDTKTLFIQKKIKEPEQWGSKKYETKMNGPEFKVLYGPSPDNPTSTSLEQINESKSFYNMITNNGKVTTITEDPIDQLSSTKERKDKLKNKEKLRLQKFKYEYFITRIGSAPFKGYGSSIKKDATDAGNDGMAYRVYGCGNYNDGEIIVPLESTLVLPK